MAEYPRVLQDCVESTCSCVPTSSHDRQLGPYKEKCNMAVAKSVEDSTYYFVENDAFTWDAPTLRCWSQPYDKKLNYALNESVYPNTKCDGTKDCNFVVFGGGVPNYTYNPQTGLCDPPTIVIPPEPQIAFLAIETYPINGQIMICSINGEESCGYFERAPQRKELMPGKYKIYFKSNILGWFDPAPIIITLNDGDEKLVTAEFSAVQPEPASPLAALALLAVPIGLILPLLKK